MPWRVPAVTQVSDCDLLGASIIHRLSRVNRRKNRKEGPETCAWKLRDSTPSPPSCSVNATRSCSQVTSRVDARARCHVSMPIISTHWHEPSPFSSSSLTILPTPPHPELLPFPNCPRSIQAKAGDRGDGEAPRRGTPKDAVLPRTRAPRGRLRRRRRT